MIKAIFIDLDGIIIRKKEKLFSQYFSEENNIPYESVLEFFQNDFKKCSFGKADLKEVIKSYLEKWNYKGTTDEFLSFWFKRESEINKEILNLIDAKRKEGIKYYIATRQEEYRKDYTWNTLGMKDHFDGVFCTCDIGYDKCEKEYWDYVFNTLKLLPEEIMFFDDRKENVDIAKSLGVQAFLYKDTNSFTERINLL
ncbi:MAG: HAD-IA family hydrolase [Candidatus Paceibacterota bacterium]